MLGLLAVPERLTGLRKLLGGLAGRVDAGGGLATLLGSGGRLGASLTEWGLGGSRVPLDVVDGWHGRSSR